MARFWSFLAKKSVQKKTTLFFKGLNQKSDSYKVFPTWIGNFCTCQNFCLGPQKKVWFFFEHFPIFFQKNQRKLHNLSLRAYFWLSEVDLKFFWKLNVMVSPPQKHWVSSWQKMQLFNERIWKFTKNREN